jgi:hypothetical protein
MNMKKQRQIVVAHAKELLITHTGEMKNLKVLFNRIARYPQHTVDGLAAFALSIQYFGWAQ